MSKAREIAEERFAKGEISAQELHDIVSRLSSAAPTPAPAPVMAPAPAATGGGVESFFKFIGSLALYAAGGAIAYIVIVNVFGGSGIKGLETANILDYGNKVTFDISNTSKKSGDVLAYIQRGESSERCMHVFEMRPGTIKDLTLPCDTGSSGAETVLYVKWADAGGSQGLLNLADRIKVDW